MKGRAWAIARVARRSRTAHHPRSLFPVVGSPSCARLVARVRRHHRVTSGKLLPEDFAHQPNQAPTVAEQGNRSFWGHSSWHCSSVDWHAKISIDGTHPCNDRFVTMLLLQ